MKEEKKEAPIGVLWGWGKPYHNGFPLISHVTQYGK